MKSLRQCLGHFATGVTVITCASRDGEACGITANSFSSVSLEPPLVLWNVAKTTESLHAYLNAPHFAIHVLKASQEDVSIHFAQSRSALFDDIEFETSDDGVPLLREYLALFECSTTEIHEGGDHHIIVGRVERYAACDGEPLLFYGGGYRRLR